MFSIPPNIAAFPIMSVSTKECLLVHYWSSAPLVLLLLCSAFSESPLIMIVSIASGILGVLVLGGTIIALLLCQSCRRPVQDPVHVAVHPGGLPQKKNSILQKSQAHAPPPQRSISEEEEEENGEMDYLNVTVLRLPRIPPTASSALRKS
ncbi:uncharacterized protein LOC112230601 isoform X2 [Oncorhynchus tshawytscha]|uniref:uncharacterized protein LOC112230601 isoform X2 n=1 Tax=Oncorhynchus tshawytscha TaxID=74940 RepID=UPI000D0A5DC5|nr:uncharacterized protein LOC112230601 isoform X2 [Oncorhynchus tshawytscha]